MELATPRVSVWEGALACVFVIVLCLAALVWVLFAPVPDRSFQERPVREAASVEAWNARVVAETLRSFDPISPCPGVDAWHRAAGVP